MRLSRWSWVFILVAPPLMVFLAVLVQQRMLAIHEPAIRDRATGELIAMLESPACGVEAAQELRRRGEEVIDALVAALSDARLGRPAAQVLGTIGGAGIRASMEVLRTGGPRRATLGVLAFIYGGNAGRSALAGVLQTDAAETRAHVLEALSAFARDAQEQGMWQGGADEFLDALVHSYRRDDATEELKESTLRALAAAGPEVALASPFLGWIITRDREASPASRALAVRTLGLVSDGSPETVIVIISALRDSDQDVRREAVVVAGQLRPVSPRVITALLEVLRKDVVSVRVEVCETLGRLGREARETLRELERITRERGTEDGFGAAAAKAIEDIRGCLE